jgi:hypothetical protein
MKRQHLDIEVARGRKCHSLVPPMSSASRCFVFDAIALGAAGSFCMLAIPPPPAGKSHSQWLARILHKHKVQLASHGFGDPASIYSIGKQRLSCRLGQLGLQQLNLMNHLIFSGLQLLVVANAFFQVDYSLATFRQFPLGGIELSLELRVLVYQLKRVQNQHKASIMMKRSPYPSLRIFHLRHVVLEHLSPLKLGLDVGGTRDGLVFLFVLVKLHL